MSGLATIYALVDPRDHEVRYIGRTAWPLIVRAANHGGDGCGVRLQKWVRQLRARGLRPVLVELARVDGNSCGAVELRYIRAYGEGGARLLNVVGNPKDRRWEPGGKAPWEHAGQGWIVP